MGHNLFPQIDREVQTLKGPLQHETGHHRSPLPDRLFPLAVVSE